ncbi:MAG TPA: hypothetical protein VL527_13700 [Dongiaceae bacterium]|nr:hypothetical protein [Dongiaceae bacterium]
MNRIARQGLPIFGGQSRGRQRREGRPIFPLQQFWFLGPRLHPTGPVQQDSRRGRELPDFFGGENQMMRQKIGAPGEVQPGILDTRQHMIPGAAQIHNAAAKDGAFPAAAQGKMLVVAPFFELEHEGLAQGGTARHRAVARAPGHHPARRARVDELLGHDAGGG